ncbi:MAG: sodium/proline symporter [Lachnospiraceae bacterium]|nr:sodium/proline symporter [Lachnospiraceae bacterium]
MNRSTQEVLAFVLYLVAVLAIGVFFFLKSKKEAGGDKSYFLGNRKMNGLVAALSAGASDMSAWVLMGLPGSIYLYGMGQVWISIGLLTGTVLAWIFIAPKLRRFSIIADDAITIPQFLTNRFKAKSPILLIISAVVFIVAYCVYAASSITACGTLFQTVFGLSDDKKTLVMVGAMAIILIYTFLGGFNAVCWTDFVQGMMMLIAIMAAPIIAVIAMGKADFTPLAPVVTDENYYNLLSSGKFDWKSISDILSGFGWGLGYFGMPHILIRYMAIRSEKEMKKSRITGIIWTAIILAMATIVALVGHEYLGSYLAEGQQSTVFITMVRSLFPAFIGGLLLSAILAASMSTADSQLLASSSAFASDVYKKVIRKKADDKEMLLVGRLVVALISVIALVIALSPNNAGIMALVECAWGAFGAAFGPVMILALYWKRYTFKGAIAGITVGFLVDALWYAFLSKSTGLYEIIPGFICGLITSVLVTLIDKEPSKEIEEMFEKAEDPVD